MSGGFGGGFADGFSGTFGAAMGAVESRKNRESAQKQFEARQEQFNRSFEEQKRQFDTRIELSQEQEQRLQEHQAWQRQAQEKQMELQERQFQVGISQKLEKAFDPRVPRPIRGVILGEAARHMGLDVDGEQFKSKVKLFEKLDNDTLGLVGTLLSSRPVEERNAIASGVLNGQIEISQVMEMAQQYRRGDVLQDILGGGGGQQQSEAGGQSAAGGQPGAPGQPAGQPPAGPGDRTLPTLGGATGVRSLDAGLGTVDRLIAAGELQMAGQVMSRLKLFAENSPEVQGSKTAMDVMRERELQIVRAEGTALGERQAPVEPRLLRFLGKEPSGATTAQQLAEEGIVIPTPEQVEQLQVAEAGVLRLNNVASDMLNLFENRPETLGLTGSIARSIESIGQQTTALLNGLGVDTSGVDMDEPGLKQAAAKIGSHLQGLTDVATDAAQVQSVVINMAYAAAASEGLQGRAITNRDIERMMAQLGQSQSPEQFAAVIRSFVARQNTAYADKFEMLTGTRKQPKGFFVGDLKNMTEKDIEGLRLELLPDEALQDMIRLLQEDDE